MKTAKRLAALILAAVLVLGALPVYAAGDLTRREALEMLMLAAEDYNPGVQQSDVVHGYGDGNLGLEDPVTKVQALLMIRRAFGGFEKPVGDNARSAAPAEDYSDIPLWAAEELPEVLGSGMLAGDGSGLLSPKDHLSSEDLDLLMKRVYALKGTNLKDDYYAAVNKEWLASSDIPAGLTLNGPFYGLTVTVQNQIFRLIADIVGNPWEKGSPEARIKALYESVMDLEGREKAGNAPIQKYIDAFVSAKTVDELVEADMAMNDELRFSMLLGFGLTTDSKDSDRYMVSFSVPGTLMDKDVYLSESPQKEPYDRFNRTYFSLAGLDESEAEAYAALVFEGEKTIAAASMDPQEYGDVDKTYNVFTLDGLKTVFPGVDLDRVYEGSGLQMTDRIKVTDVSAMKAAASMFCEEGLGCLKALALRNLLLSVGGLLGSGYTDAANALNYECYGIVTAVDPQTLAFQQITSLLSVYLARAYVENHFSEEAKTDVENMIREFIGIYKERIAALDWMSEETKEKAIHKLDTMKIKVGYPDKWDDSLDGVEMLSPDEGGSFFSNVIALQAASIDLMVSKQFKEVEKESWIMTPYTVNACYSATSNDITFPAAILQAPLYDLNAKREENLGGIGYIIAHEITHAFDNNGAKYDEFGNAADWWTPEDYAAFTAKCEEVARWYEGVEVYPGIECSGYLTLSENVADLGSARCLIEAIKRVKEPDYDVLFRAIANTWASTTTRAVRELLSKIDVHSPDKLRCNRVLQTLDEFYETYGIGPGDGMWTEPETRVSIW